MTADEEPLSADDAHEVLAAARIAGAVLNTPVVDLVGFVSAVRRRLGFHPTDWADASYPEVLAELDNRLHLAPQVRVRFADQALARRRMTDRDDR